jgi:hypothetical protein
MSAMTVSSAGTPDTAEADPWRRQSLQSLQSSPMPQDRGVEDAISDSSPVFGYAASIARPRWKQRPKQKISNMTFVRAQHRLDGAVEKLTSFLLHEADGKVKLEGDLLKVAEKTMTDLRHASEDVFERFAVWNAHVEAELRFFTESEEVSAQQMESAIMAARLHIGARALIGAESIEVGEQLNVGVIHDREEPQNPWTAHSFEPPWGVSYRKAANRLAALSPIEGGQKQHHATVVRHLLQNESSATSMQRLSPGVWNHMNEDQRINQRRGLAMRAQVREERCQRRLKAMASRQKMHIFNRSVCFQDIDAFDGAARLKMSLTTIFAED